MTTLRAAPSLALLVCLLGITTSASAFYRNATPPSGWAGSGGSYTYGGTSGATAAWTNGAASLPSSISVGGRTISIAGTIRAAPGISNWAVAAVRAHPGTAATAAVAAWLLPFAIEYYNGAFRSVQRTVPTWCYLSDCTGPGVGSTYQQALDGRLEQLLNALRAANPTKVYAWIGPATYPSISYAVVNGTRSFSTNGTGSASYSSQVSARCPSGSGWIGPGQTNGVATCTQPVTPVYEPTPETEWDKLRAVPVPDQVTRTLDDVSPLPQALPEMQPTTVPTGSPQAIPDTTPQQYRQPVSDIVPRPTTQEPWRYDEQPRDVIGTDPVGLPDPVATPGATGGTAGEQEPIELCGLPGTPPCKIDEAGTAEPDTSVDIDADVSNAQKPLDDLIADPDSVLPAFPSLSWNFSLPTGCAVIDIAAFAPYLTGIDICQFQPLFHDIMSMVWVLGGLFGAISMFWRNTLAT